MAKFLLRRFSCPETLKHINPVHLLAFLEPHRSYLDSRRLLLPRPKAAADLDYQLLVNILMTPNEKAPPDLNDSLYFVDEMATPEGMDALLMEAEKHSIPLSSAPDHTPEDVAVQIWNLNRGVLERKHAETNLTKVRSFESYQMEVVGKLMFKRPTQRKLDKLSTELGDFFEQKNRGRGAKVMMFDRHEEVWFLIRHGEPFRREESLVGGAASSICYRPLKYDVVVFSPPMGELRIHANSKGEKELYRCKFGKYLFGSEEAFPGTDRYSLAPLREMGEDSVSTAAIDGIDYIKLVEVQFHYGGYPWELITRKSDDLFALFASRGISFPESGRICRASFLVKFTDSKTPRSVVIKPPNIARFIRDDDSVLVEKWLETRGFIIREAIDASETQEILAGH